MLATKTLYAEEERIMWKEFREFAMRGSVIDLAVGVVIGAAFGKITSSLVDDVLMPPIGLLLGKVDFSNLFVVLGSGQFASLADAKKAGVPVFAYGAFINTLINFLIVAFAIFLVIKQVNRFKREAPPAPAAPAPEVVLLTEIRDALQARR